MKNTTLILHATKKFSIVLRGKKENNKSLKYDSSETPLPTALGMTLYLHHPNF
jgi:hypothetical protein